MSGKYQTSKGIAAIEFALLLMVLLVMLSGLFAYSMVLQAQQSVTRATGDGARLLQHLVEKGLSPDALKPEVKNAVQHGIQAAGLANSADTQVDLFWSAAQVKIVVSYPNPIALHLWSGLPVLRRLEAQVVVNL